MRFFVFTSKNCVPCRMMKVVLDQFEKKNPNIRIEYKDVEENIDLSTSYGIRSVPSILVFDEDNNLVNVSLGKMLNLEELEKLLEQ